jgi:hypothetical protein
MSDFDLDRYKSWAIAYAEDIFLPLDGDAVKKTGHYDTQEKRLIITRASAAMGRHMIEKFGNPMIAEIERLRKELDMRTPVGLRKHDE